MIRLSAFADEISPDLNEQIAVLRSENIHYLDLRGVWGTNVLDLTDEQVATIKQALDAGGIGVAAIGTPIGKVPIDSSFDEQLHRFERAITLAREFQTPYVRIFSFYPPASLAAGSQVAAPADHRDEVLRRVREMTDRARAADVVLLHENERDIYGDTIARCVDLMGSVDDAHFQAALDPANFVVCGQVPYPDAYDALRSWVQYVHVTDVRADGALAPAGEGVARWPHPLQRLRQGGYDGGFFLEAHLTEAGQYLGGRGHDLSPTAVH